MRGRGIAAAAVFAAVLAGCGTPAAPRGRLDGAGAPVPVAERGGGDVPGPLSTTPVDTYGPTTTPPAADSSAPPSTGAACDTAPAAFLPSSIEGYTVAPEDSAALAVLGLSPTMRGLVAIRVTRRDGASAEAVAASAAAYTLPGVSDADALVLVMRSIGLQGEPAPVALGSRPAATGRSAAGDTIFAWLPCRNVIVAVFGTDATMVGDVARRVSAS